MNSGWASIISSTTLAGNSTMSETRSKSSVLGVPDPPPIAWGTPAIGILGFSGFGDDYNSPYVNLQLHLPVDRQRLLDAWRPCCQIRRRYPPRPFQSDRQSDRKSTRLNSSHRTTSYAV